MGTHTHLLYTPWSISRDENGTTPSMCEDGIAVVYVFYILCECMAL